MNYFVFTWCLCFSILRVFSQQDDKVTESGRDFTEDGDLKLVYRLYEECVRKDFMGCLKTKAITFFDRAYRKEQIPVFSDFVVLKRTAEISVADKNKPPLSETELESSLPRNLDERSNRLDELLIDRMSKFFQTHRLEVKFPWKQLYENVGQGKDEL